MLPGSPLPAAQRGDEDRDYRYLMGTSVQVKAIGGDAGGRRAAINEAFAAMAEVDRLMSNYRSDSELTRLNREAASGPVVVSEPLWRVIEAAQRVSAMSDGAFDVTVGPLVRLWGFRDKTPHLPSPTELEGVRPLVGYRGLTLDATRHTVRFARAGMEIDLGGIAKGFAVEIAADVLRRRGLSGLVDAGGNQYMLGTPTGKTLWTVGIKDPDAAGRLLGVVEVHDGSVSTSADYANFLVASGRTYGHLLDPRTLQPSSASLSATIVSADGTLADAMSKAAFILGPKQGLALIDATPGMAGVIAYRNPDGTVAVAVSRRIGWRPAR
ncbi:MAG: FAD:protein FMN transferase [Acidobacteriota bacterium]